MIAHFVVSSVQGVMITLCEKYIGPRDFNTASVGAKPAATVCPECKEKVDDAWVTFVSV